MEAGVTRSQFSNLFLKTMLVVLFGAMVSFLEAPRQVLADVADCNTVGGSFSSVPEPECVISNSQTKSGSFTINSKLRIANTGSITVPPLSGGNTLTLTVNGDFTMDSGSTIDGSVTTTGGIGAHIKVDVTGNISMLSGAMILSNQPAPSCTGGKGGAVELLADGNVSIAKGAEIHVDAKCSAGEVIIDAGVDAFVDGLVSSMSDLSGVGNKQPPGGGPITIKAGCTATLDDNAVVSSKGKDPGADLVHIEGGCAVKIFGKVESTLGHAVPNTPQNHCNLTNRPHDTTIEPAACIEIWSGGSLIISNVGGHNGEINTDTAQTGGHKIAWVDIFARGDISISGPSSGAALSCNQKSNFAVHSNEPCLTDSDGGIITVKSTEGKIVTTGRAIQASAPTPGSAGGAITLQANTETTLDSATLEAKGDDDATGGFGKGGSVNARSFNSTLSWQNGIGSVLPAGLGIAPHLLPAAQRGKIVLQDCTAGALSTAGSSFPTTGPPETPSMTPKIEDDACGNAPTLPAYVTLPACACVPGISINKTCVAAIDPGDPTGSKVRVDFQGQVSNTGGVTLTDLQVTDTTQPPVSGIIFDQVPSGSLPKGQSADYKGHYFVTPQAGALNFSDTVTATSKYQSATVTSQPFTASCALSVEPKITVTKACKNPSTAFPNPVEFTGKVCNDGPEQLTNVTVTDSPEAKTPPGVTLTSTVLNPVDPGKCADYSGSYIPTQVGLQQKDTVTAVGQGKLSGKNAMATASALCDVVGPAIDVTKSCSSAVSADGKTIVVTVSGTIKNTGGVPLTITKLMDSPPATLTPQKTSLDVNETTSFSGSYTIAAIPPAGISDTVTVEAKDTNNNTVSKDASAQCSLEIDPSVTIDEQCSDISVGNPLKFSGKVCNTGKEELKNLVISDDKGSTITPNNITLPPPPSGGQSCVNYSGQYTPSGTGSQTNNVQVVGMGTISGKTAKATSFATCTVLSQPAISVTKECSCIIDSSGTSASIQFTGKVCNPGNENLTNVQIFDNKPSADTLVKTIPSLSPGDANCVSYSSSYPTTTLTNTDTVTASGFGAISGTKVTAQAEAACGCNATPDITVTTACSPAVGPVGSPLSFTGKVCSTGNLALGNVTVVSSKPKPNTNITLPKTTLAALAAGQTPGDAQCTTYSGKYSPNGAGSFSHTVTAAGQSLLGKVTKQASVTATCVLGQSCFPADWVGLAAVNSWFGYSPKQKVSSVFSIPSSLAAVGKLTLVQALGGVTINGAAQKAAANLIKEAIAALLNAAHPQVTYPIENTATIIAQVNAALASAGLSTTKNAAPASDNLSAIKNLANTFSTYNKLGGAPAICQTTPPPC